MWKFIGYMNIYSVTIQYIDYIYVDLFDTVIVINHQWNNKSGISHFIQFDPVRLTNAFYRTSILPKKLTKRTGFTLNGNCVSFYNYHPK